MDPDDMCQFPRTAQDRSEEKLLQDNDKLRLHLLELADFIERLGHTIPLHIKLITKEVEREAQER